MKTTLLTFLMLISLQIKAKENFIVTTDCHGEVRYGSYFGDSTYVPLESQLTVELAKKSVMTSVERRYAGFVVAEIQCDYKFNPNTFYRLRHQANVEIVAKLKNGLTVHRKFNCDATVNDGGYQTLKKTCVKKMAQKIRTILDREL